MNALADDPWQRLRGHTAARIGLARSGAALATRPALDLRLAHARARDAVAAALDVDRLAADLGEPCLAVRSAAGDRRAYLLRPDLGRLLAEGTALPAVAADLAVCVVDGLSAGAVQAHAAPLLVALRPLLPGWRLAPTVIVRLGRVAIGDAVAARLGVGAVLALIGERPGLSAPDSMGAYLTWRPGPGATDANRNCVSNIRPAGLPPGEAARTIAWLLQAMRARGLSGVALKDGSGLDAQLAPIAIAAIGGSAPSGSGLT